MKLKLKKRDLFLFSGFVFLFFLFACFQNFEMITDVEKEIQAIPEQAVKNGLLKIRFFRPYFFKDHIGNLVTPEGFTATIHHHDGPIIFDEKKYLDDVWRNSPLYNDTKQFFDWSSSHADSQAAPAAPCVQDPAASSNNCFTNYNGPSEHSGSGMKFRANPLRRTASVSYDGAIDSQLVYDESGKSVNLEFTKKLNSHSNLNLEMKSQDQSGQVKIDWNW